ncbi:hypothetical protein ACOSQ2_033408 [Xanthoceras sorbifolium]
MDNILSLSNSRLCLSVKASAPPPPPEPPNSSDLRRPKSLKPTTPINKKVPLNPLKNLFKTTRLPSPPSNQSLHLCTKLRLSSKLAPPPPPPPPPLLQLQEDNEIPNSETSSSKDIEFRQEGKIFVGNLPNWIKKYEVAEFFRQFGPIKNVILIKGHNSTEKNAGFGFVIYDSSTAEKSAIKAVEFDGVEFHGRVLTVKLDDGKRLKEKTQERAHWVEGAGEEQFKSKWHQERERDRMDFRKVVETQPENWQAVVTSFERIKKPSRREFGLMVNYYARRGDMHRARQTFENMRARGIEPTSHVYTNW